MDAYTQRFLSSKPNGGFLSIADTGSPGTLVHTTPASDIDNVYLWLAPTGNNDVICVVLINGVAAFQVKVSKDLGPVAVLTGAPLTGSTTIHVYADTAGRAAAFGSVDRITPSGTVSTRRFSRKILSGSVSGRPTLITATTSPGNTIHAAHATATDLVWVKIGPNTASDTEAWLYDGTTTIHMKVLKDIGPSWFLQGIPVTNGVTISAYAAAANILNVNGGVDRIQ